MTDVLIYGDTIRHPELRHEVPLTLGDPFLYAEKDGRRHIVITDFEWPRLQEAGVDAELISPFGLGLDELLDSGKKYWQIALELTVRGVKQIGVTQAIVPHTMSLRQPPTQWIRAATHSLSPSTSTSTRSMTSRRIALRSASVVLPACQRAGTFEASRRICSRCPSERPRGCSLRNRSCSSTRSRWTRSFSSQAASRLRPTSRFSGSTA